MIALSALHSRADPSAYARQRMLSSLTDFSSALPEGTGKIFLLQCTTSAYVEETDFMKLSALSEPNVKDGFAIGAGAGRGGSEWVLFRMLLVKAAKELAVEAAVEVGEL